MKLLATSLLFIATCMAQDQPIRLVGVNIVLKKDLVLVGGSVVRNAKIEANGHKIVFLTARGKNVCISNYTIHVDRLEDLVSDVMSSADLLKRLRGQGDPDFYKKCNDPLSALLAVARMKMPWIASCE